MKKLELKEGYLVSDWNGEVTKVFYKLIPHLHYGSIEERFLLVNEGNVFLEMLPEHKRRFICDTLEKAKKLAQELKKERVSYYEKQIKDYQKSIEELI